jgi:3-oxoacyl-[acyl-carrier protein] reductase
VCKHNVTINGLLPGPFNTDRIRGTTAAMAAKAGKTFEEALADVGRNNPTGRIGDPAEFGDACAFLCSASAGFIVGQNLVMDGGSFNSSMG